MDPLILILFSIAIVAVVLSIVVGTMLLRTQKANVELRQSHADRAAKAQELEHLKAQLGSAAEDANAVQELRVEVGRLESDLNAAKEVAERANESNERLQARCEELQVRVQDLTARVAELSEGNRALKAQLGDRDQLEKRFADTFDSLATKSLSRQGQQLTEAANRTLKEREVAVEKLVKPLSERIERLDKARIDSGSALLRQIELLTHSKDQLAAETERLSSALKFRPQVRGQWGEMQVESALQLGGLVKGKNYFAQQTLEDRLKPDFIVKMPHGRDLAIDSKVPLNAYLEAENADDVATRDAALDRHADAVREYARQLASKAYHSQLPPSIDYTVMVVPEFAIAPAEQRDPDLVVRALRQSVLITTHSNLVALVSTVALGWKEHQMHQEASNVAELAAQLHDRLTVYAGHVVSVGKSLDDAVKRYNDSIGSLERNVITSVNRFPALGVPTKKTMPNPQPIESSIRPLTKVAPQSEEDSNTNGAMESPDYSIDHTDDDTEDLFMAESRGLT